MSVPTTVLLFAPQLVDGHTVSVTMAGAVALDHVCHWRESVDVPVLRQYRTRMRLKALTLPAAGGAGLTVSMIRSHGSARSTAEGCAASADGYAVALSSSRDMLLRARRALSCASVRVRLRWL